MFWFHMFHFLSMAYSIGSVLNTYIFFEFWNWNGFALPRYQNKKYATDQSLLEIISFYEKFYKRNSVSIAFDLPSQAAYKLSY